MNMNTDFQNEITNLLTLNSDADLLQAKFRKAAEDFKEKFKNYIFNYPGETEEWVLTQVSGWSFRLYFTLMRINRKCPDKLTKDEKYISFDEFRLLEFKNKKLENKRKEV